MKKSQFKILIKEYIKEVLLEEKGVLAHLISEVAQSLVTNAPVLQETRTPVLANSDDSPLSKHVPNNKSNLQEQRQKMLSAINADAYGGVDLFEGTTPMSSGGKSESLSGVSGEAPSSPLSGTPHDDPGVDITGIMNVGNAEHWKKLANS